MLSVYRIEMQTAIYDCPEILKRSLQDFKTVIDYQGDNSGEVDINTHQGSNTDAYTKHVFWDDRTTA